MCLSGIVLLIQVLAISGTFSLQSDVSARNRRDYHVAHKAIHPYNYWMTHVYPISSEVHSLKKEIDRMKIMISRQKSSIETLKNRESGMVVEFTHRKWPYKVRVTFETPFQEAPKLTHGLTIVDASPSRTLRVRSDVGNVTNKGFQAVLQTWADSILYGARMTWMACGY